jgi:hypothetical protein
MGGGGREAVAGPIVLLPRDNFLAIELQMDEQKKSNIF